MNIAPTGASDFAALLAQAQFTEAGTATPAAPLQGVPSAPAGAAHADALSHATGVASELLLSAAIAQVPIESAYGSSPAEELAAGGRLASLAQQMQRSATAESSPQWAASATQSDAALPAVATALPNSEAATLALLTPQPVPGLIAQPATTPRQADPQRPDEEDVPRRRSPLYDDEDDDGDGDDASPSPPADARAARRDESAQTATPAAPPAPPPPAVWGEPLRLALQEARHDPVAQAALRTAFEAWDHGRAALLAFPQRAGNTGRGWLFVLRADGADGPLRGTRCSAHFAWARSTDQPRWWTVRVAKAQGSGAHRLATLAGPGDAPGFVTVELQLGPARTALARWSEVLVRVESAERLWSAIGLQWSLPLLVCNRPLLDARGIAPVTTEDLQ